MSADPRNEIGVHSVVMFPAAPLKFISMLDGAIAQQV